MIVEEINQKLKAKGHRHSRLREVLLETLIDNDKPLSAGEILSLLNANNLKPNKTTIYRELETLKKENIIAEINLLDGKKRYEFSSKDQTKQQHPHLICTNCGDIQRADFEQSSKPLENILVGKTRLKNNFKVTSQALQFFGLCANCS